MFCGCLRRHPKAREYAGISAAAVADAAHAAVKSSKPRDKMSRPPPKLELPGGHGVLSTIRLSDVLGASPHGVVRLAHTQTIGDALRILAQYNILSAPGACRGRRPKEPRRMRLLYRARDRPRAPPRPTAREQR